MADRIMPYTYGKQYRLPIYIKTAAQVKDTLCGCLSYKAIHIT